MTGKLDKRLSEFDKLSKDVKSLLRLLEFAGQKKWHMTFSAAFSIVSEALGIVPYVLIYLVVVRLMDPPLDPGCVFSLAVIALLSVVGLYVCFYVSILFSHVAAFDVVYGLRRDVLAHPVGVSMGYFTGRSSGSIAKVLGDDVERLEVFIGPTCPPWWRAGPG